MKGRPAKWPAFPLTVQRFGDNLVFMLNMLIKEIVVLGVPMLASQLSHFFLHAADTAMVGRLGTVPLAGIGMGSLFSAVLFTAVWPVWLGVQALAARRNGSGREFDRVGEVVDTGIVIGLVAAAAGFAGSFAAPWIIGRLTGDPLIREYAAGYVSVMRFLLPAVAFASASSGFLAAVKRTKSIMIANIGKNVINIALNYVLIFGKLGFPAMGIRGAALGSVISEWLSALFLVSRVMAPELRLKYRTLFFDRVSAPVAGSILRTSLPPMVQNQAALFMFLVFEGFLGRLGAVYLAATHVVFSLFSINKTLVGGFADGASILVGNALGAGDTGKARRCFHAQEIIALAIGSAVLLAALLFPSSLASIFTGDPESLAAATRAVRIFAPFFFIEVLGYSFELIFAGNGWGRFVLCSEFSTNVLFMIGLSWLLLFHFGLGAEAGWYSFGVYQVAHASILFSGFLSGRWKKVEVEPVKSAV